MNSDASYGRVLITGAAGGIGTVLRRGLKGRYPVLRLSDVAEMEPAAAGEEVVSADLSDYEAVEAAVSGCDAVLHFGGIPKEDAWDPILGSNVCGTFNVYEAARRCGVKRVVFASSNHAVGFWRRDQTIGTQVPVRPDSLYGLSKVFGEGLARLYADKYAIPSVCLRIGQFRPRPTNLRMLSLWLSPADMVRLAHRSLEADGVHFEVVYGISDNTRAWYDKSGADRIGYRGLDNAEDYADEVMADPAAVAEDDVGGLFQGGPFCADDFHGDTDKIS